jgi:hypothetical protein
MRVYRTIEYKWDGEKYVLDKADYFDYNGPVALACGASSEQKAIGAQQSDLFKQMTQQSQQVFGASNKVFNQLVNTFSPTIAAGPNQQGFSPALLSAMNASAIQNVGQAYKNAKAAVGNAQAAYGGGNVALPSGAQIGTDLSLAESAANQTSSTLNQITQENYAVGRDNYNRAVTGLEQAPNVFNAATSAGNAATGAGEAAANTQNQIAQESNSWISAVTGALGTVAGAATGPLVGNFTKNLGGRQGASNTGNG